jgi:hypothetical protein
MPPQRRRATVHLVFASRDGSIDAVEAGRRAVAHAIRTRSPMVEETWDEHGVSLVFPVGSRSDSAPMRQLLDHIVALVRRTAPSITVTRGIGPVAADARTSPASARLAAVTARLGGLLYGPGSSTSYSDLGPYPALYEALHADGTRSAFGDLVDRYLGVAARYEQEAGLPILDTLAAYFAERGNAAATARALGLNRQSLLYRLERFESLSGVDLGSPIDRFALELAVRCWPIRQARST